MTACASRNCRCSGSGREQAARAARREQQRYRLGAEIDGKGAVAPQPGLGCDIGNMAAPRIGHGIDAVRAHDKPRGIDLGGSFGDLDLRALHVAELGAVVGRGAMPRDVDIIVQTGLRIAQAYAGKHIRKQREHRQRIKRIWIDGAARASDRRRDR